MAAFLGKMRETTWWVLAAAVVAYAGIVFLLSATYDGPLGRAVYGLEKATSGFIGPQLIFPLFALAVVTMIIFGIGRLRGADVGWRASALIPAVVFMLIFWTAMQAALWVTVKLRGGQPAWNEAWNGNAVIVIAALLTQLLGNALVEETVFRGFLLPQAYIKTSRISGKAVALVGALLVSQSLFLLSHVPRLFFSMDLTGLGLIQELFWVFRFGMLHAIAYLVTRNLFVCVGLHALWNAPTPLVQVTWQVVTPVWWVLSALLLFGWWLARSAASRR